MLRRFPAFLLVILLSGFSLNSNAQVHIVENDTALCSPGPLALHATVDSSQVSTGLSTQDDYYSNVVNIGFPFTFYGNTYTQCILGTNFTIKFNLAQAGAASGYVITANNPFPTATQSLGTNVIMGPWLDTNPDVNNPAFANSMDYKVVGTAPNRIFIYSFCEVPMYSCTQLYFSAQIMLFESTNVIETHINHKPQCAWNGGQAVIGLQDSTGQYATIVPGRNTGTQWTADNEAYRFTPTSDTSYALDTIAYGPIPIYSGGGVHWYENGTLLGTGLTLNTNLPSGIHQIVAEVHGCYVSSSYDTINIVVGAPAVQNDTDVPCAQAATGTASVQLANNFTYHVIWFDGNGAVIDSGFVTGGDTISGLTAGTYSLLLSDSAGCESTLNYTVGIVPNAAIAAVSQQNPACVGTTNGYAAVQLSSSTPYSVVWTNLNDSILQEGTETGSDTLFNLGPGNYYVKVTDTFGCVSDTAFTIAVVPVSVVPVVSAPNVECPESHAGFIAIQLSNTGVFQSSWTDTSGAVVGQNTFAGIDTLHNRAPGDYFLTLTDAAGCTYSFTYSIGSNTYTVDFSQDVDTICAGGVVNFTSFTDEVVTQYTWTYGDGATDQQPYASHVFAEAGTYGVNLTIANSDYGCTASAVHPVFVREIIDADYISTAPACAGAPVYFSDVSTAHPAEWTWSFGALASSNEKNPVITFNEPGTYAVNFQVVDSFCGVDSKTGTIEVHPFPVVNLEPDTSVICKGQSVAFDAGNAGDTYIWSTGETSQQISPVFQDDVLIRVTVDHLGCQASDSAFVEVACDMEMPNAFTPNGDNVNDFFRPVGHNILNYQLKVFDRWGHVVYSTNNTAPGGANEGWDGTINGKPAEIGVYSYVVHGVLLTDLVVDQTGNVTLLR